jgi:cytochrome c553
MGATPTTVPVTFSLPSGSNLSGQLQLWLQIHGLEYQTQASVQANGGAWIPINDSTATYLGHSGTFGGIGGGFATLQLTINLPAGSIQTGQNTLTFSFNGTNGISSGFRVLNLNVLTADGGRLIPETTFVQDDPSTWSGFLTDQAEIAEGLSLWQSAALTDTASGARVAIKAHCGDCHAQDGRDLKYFNYSNRAIETRAMFHGLTRQQGAQIASYIRTLNVPASSYGRPWNPPYQPGPGTDSRAVSDWAAGAGIDAVLDLDADGLPYIMPGGSTANLAANAYLNQREIPIMLQLPDWNHWLPTVYPLDAFGSEFSNSGMLSGYSKLRSELVPNDPTTYAQYHTDISAWSSSSANLYASVLQPETSSAWSNPVYDREIYSVAQWLMVKSWEINHEYGLEGMSKAVFGPQAADRAWYTDQAFFTSPQMLKIPSPAPGIGNGTVLAHDYEAFIWYQTQLILNDGNGHAKGTNPIDWGYAMAYLVNNLTWDAVNNRPRVGTAGLLSEWTAKEFQAGDPDVSPYGLIRFPAPVSTWSEITTTQKLLILNAFLQVWLDEFQPMTPQRFFSFNRASTVFSSVTPGTFSGDLAYALPELRYAGADPSLLTQVAAWATQTWPAFNWVADLNTSCEVKDSGSSYSPIICP